DRCLDLIVIVRAAGIVDRRRGRACGSERRRGSLGHLDGRRARRRGRWCLRRSGDGASRVEARLSSATLATHDLASSRLLPAEFPEQGAEQGVTGLLGIAAAGEALCDL